MAYQLVTTRSGQEYAVDWDVVSKLTMSYHRSRYQLEKAEARRSWDGSITSISSWGLPVLQNVEVDWDAVRSNTNLSAFADVFRFRNMADRSVRDVAVELKAMVTDTAINRRNFADWMKEVQAANMIAMNASVDNYEGIIDVLRYTRDLSADFVAVGSTIATGGAAAAMLGGSAAMKGTAKWQDTGNVGAAVLYGTGHLALGAFKIGGKALSSGMEWTLIVVEAGLESTTSWVAGDSFDKVVETGALKFLSLGAAQAFFGLGPVKSIFEKAPLPAGLTAKINSSWVSQLIDNPLTEETGKQIVEKGSAAVMQAGVQAGRELLTKEAGGPNTGQAGLVYEMPLTDLALVDMAIVNMKLGIGRGW